MATFQQVDRCRICGNPRLVPLLDLGSQYLTGVFPRQAHARMTSGPLELVMCDAAGGHCGLVQLRHSFDLAEMYGENYGYRSSLNRSMVEHLKGKVQMLREMVQPAAGDLVIDIGSNDGTLLSFYPEKPATLVGIDPTSAKFRQYYRPHIEVVTDFFSEKVVRARFGDRKAKIITSIAMFYDLEQPIAFVREIAAILADEGVWHLEQSYLPSMLETGSYDTICHEHLEYYSLHQIKWLTDRCGLKIIDVGLNDVNGGSFAITVAKAGSARAATARVAALLEREQAAGLTTAVPYEAFARRTVEHRSQLRDMLAGLRSEGKRVLGYGASTKGNVILQYCGFTPEHLPAIAEVNGDKFGCFTPGSWIPIISEQEAKAMKPDYFLVLPWHFRDNLLAREREYLAGGGRMLFPLPRIEVVGQ